jgi:hypothetical protein
VFDPEQNRSWACTGQRYRSTKIYRTTWPLFLLVPYPNFVGKAPKSHDLHSDRPQELAGTGFRILVWNEAPQTVRPVQLLDTFAVESVA